MPRKKNPLRLSRRGFLRVVAAGAAAAFVPKASGEPGNFFVSEPAEGIYFHTGRQQLPSRANGADIACVTLIEGDHAAALVDSGYSFDLGARALEHAHRLSDKPVKWVINTHVHPDHIFGNRAFENRATFCGHKNLPRLMAEAGPHYRVRLEEILGAEAAAKAELVPPERLVSPEQPEAIELGNRRLRLEAWRLAHTSTDLTVFDEKTGSLVAGDLVFDGHVPTLDGSAIGWLEALTKLKARSEIKMLVPGHGVIRDDWRRQIGKVEDYLRALLADTKRLMDEGVSLGEAATLAAASQREKWLLFDDYNPRNVAKAFVELEWL